MSSERLLKRAERVGPHAKALVHGIIGSRAHPEQAYRSCLGVLRLGKTHGNERLEAASDRAVKLGSYTFKSIEAILKNGLDQQPLDTPAADPLPKTQHENVRGGAYYASDHAKSDHSGEPAC